MKVLIAAGGTAGHINPALAIAGEIRARCPQAEVHFAGRKKGMEYGLVTRAGYPFHPIEVNAFSENSRRRMWCGTRWLCIIWRSVRRVPPRF